MSLSDDVCRCAQCRKEPEPPRPELLGVDFGKIPASVVWSGDIDRVRDNFRRSAEAAGMTVIVHSRLDVRTNELTRPALSPNWWC